MKALEKAQKKWWYDHNYDKGANHWDVNIELNVFAAGWKAALKWALEQETWIGPDEGGEWGVSKEDIEEELNGAA